MADLFSAEFLNTLRQEVKSKTKTSKALIDAIKELTQSNLNQKKTITRLQNQNTMLTHQNSLLSEMLQVGMSQNIIKITAHLKCLNPCAEVDPYIELSKNDYVSAVQLKQKKQEKAIQIQAKLIAENEGLKNQIYKLKAEIQILTNSSMTNQSYLQEQDEGRSVIEKVSFALEQDLAAYLYNGQQSVKEEQNGSSQGYQHDTNMDKHFEQKFGSEKKTMHMSQQFQSMKSSQFLTTILHNHE